jgi:putative tryptophan/tyrosine transport system substrate-binding protein
MRAKRLEILKDAAPSVTRVAVLMGRGVPSNAYVMSVVEAAAKTMNMELRPVELGSLDELQGAFSIAGSAPVDGVVITDHPLFVTNAAAVAAFTEKRRLPAIGAPIIATYGGLIGYGVDFTLMFRHAAVFVDKILKGANPGDIPIEQATKFRTVVNLRTAKALGVEISPVVLASADDLIE